tara:strand:+ start:356 stop:1120 length:765 start_codon:yes stop_codon:yes gene_type:complete
MKVVILAGGWGTRLGRYSELIPKPMVLIGNKPIIWHIMKIYSKYNFNEFIISCGVKSHVIKNFFRNYDSNNADFTINLSDNSIKYHQKHNEQDWKISVIDTGLNTLKGARIKRIEKYLDEGPNMVTYGDGLADIDIKKLLDFHNSHDKAVTITGVHPPARFGELQEENQILNSFSEKPKTSMGLVNGGFMVFNKKLLSYLDEDEKCDLEFGALEKLSKERQVMVFKHDGRWECMDHERDFVRLNNLWNRGEFFW